MTLGLYTIESAASLSEYVIGHDDLGISISILRTTDSGTKVLCTFPLSMADYLNNSREADNEALYGAQLCEN